MHTRIYAYHNGDSDDDSNTFDPVDLGLAFRQRCSKVLEEAKRQGYDRGDGKEYLEKTNRGSVTLSRQDAAEAENRKRGTH